MSNDKVAFVTGGSGALGGAIVKALVRDGCRVAFSYWRNRVKASELESELSEANGRVKAYQLDVSDAEACVRAAKEIEQDMGTVEILVNNAGATHIMPFAMIEEKDWDAVMDVNVKGMFLVTKAFARGMIRRKAGCIINIGSLAGMRMLEVPVHYATAKSAVTGFTLSLARELGRYNVRVNAVSPGMLTEGVSVNIPDRQKQQYMDYCALSRAGTVEEAAELVAFLADDRSSYINAQVISVDGGI